MHYETISKIRSPTHSNDINMLLDTSAYGLLKISGPDAKKFLQGQLTIDLEKINAHEAQLAAHCTPQGRIICLFRLFYFEEAYFFWMPNEMISIASSGLQKYALFYKVKIENASSTYYSAGGTAPIHVHSAHHLAVTGTNRYLHISDQPLICDTPSSIWRLADIHDKVPNIYPATSLQFLPHDINLHQLGAISFDKGCYTGQEIIARMHYRAKLKNHLYFAKMKNIQTALPGSDIYSTINQQKQVVGMLVDAVQQDGFLNLLFVANENSISSQTLFLNDDSENTLEFIM